MSPLSIFLFLLTLAILILMFVVVGRHSLLTRKKSWLASSAALLCAIGSLIFWAALKSVEETSPNGSEIFETSDGLAAVTSSGFGWTELPIPVRDASLTIGSHNSEEYLAIISQPKSDFAPGFTIRNYAAAANRTIANGLKKSHQSELVDFKLNGLNAARNQVSGQFGTANAEYLNTYIEGEKHFYQVRSWTTRSKQGVAFPRLKLATSTFYELAGKVDRK